MKITPDLRARLLSALAESSPEEAAAALGASRHALAAWAGTDAEIRHALGLSKERAQLARRRVPEPQPPRDTRSIVSAATVAAAIVHASEVIERAVQGSRWAGSESWARVRSFFHCLPDGVRREAIARLVREEAGRIEHDREAGFTAGSSGP